MRHFKKLIDKIYSNTISCDTRKIFCIDYIINYYEIDI